MRRMAASLTLVPIGVGAAYARPGEAQSSYLVRGGDRAVCLDLGAGALNRLQGHLRPEELDALVITHLHPDHCADLFALRVYMSWGPGRGRRLRLLGPESLPARLRAFAGEDGWDEAFAFEPLADGREVALAGGLSLRAAEVPHLPPTYALRVERNGGSICFSADCRPNDALPELARGVDLLLCECSYGADPGDGGDHLSARDAAAAAGAAGAGALLLTDCYPEHDREAALRAAREGGRARRLARRTRRWRHRAQSTALLLEPADDGARRDPQPARPRPRARLHRPLHASGHLAHRPGGDPGHRQRAGRLHRAARWGMYAALSVCAAADAIVLSAVDARRAIRN